MAYTAMRLRWCELLQTGGCPGGKGIGSDAGELKSLVKLMTYLYNGFPRAANRRIIGVETIARTKVISLTIQRDPEKQTCLSDAPGKMLM